MRTYEKGVKPDDVIKVTFHIIQDGKPAKKEVEITREKFLDYNDKTHGKQKWSELYELIVREKAYISINDLTNSN